MLDYDLASIYGVETRSLNQAVKRNIERFPSDFMFRLSENEWETVKRNTLSDSMPSQIVIASPDRRNKSAPPYAFTEHGAVMLASVLRSPSAVQIEVINDALDQLREKKEETCNPIGFKVQQG